MQERFNPGEVIPAVGPRNYQEARRELSRYRDCKWCDGCGCLYCEAEADAEYNRQFPNGPQTIATFKLPEEMDKAREAIGFEACNKAFGPEGRGVLEVIENCLRHEQTKMK